MLFRGIPKRSRHGRVLGALTYFTKCLPRKPRWVKIKQKKTKPFEILTIHSTKPLQSSETNRFEAAPTVNAPPSEDYRLSDHFTPDEVIEAFQSAMASLGEPSTFLTSLFAPVIRKSMESEKSDGTSKDDDTTASRNANRDCATPDDVDPRHQ